MKRSAFSGLLVFQQYNFTESQSERLVGLGKDEAVKGEGGSGSQVSRVKYSNLVDHHSQYSSSQNVYKFLNFEFSYKLKTGPLGYYHSGDNEMEQY